MNKRKLNEPKVVVFDRIVKASEISSLVKDFCGDVIITKKLIIDKKVDIVCNLHVIGGVVRKYPISDFDININGDFYCYGEMHCHNIKVSGCFYSQNIIYSRNIKVGEDFICNNKVDAFGCDIIVAGNLECNDIVAGIVECLGQIKIKGSVSIAAGIISGYES